MKKFMTLSAILIAALGFSQANCEALKKENEELKFNATQNEI